MPNNPASAWLMLHIHLRLPNGQGSICQDLAWSSNVWGHAMLHPPDTNRPEALGLPHSLTIRPYLITVTRANHGAMIRIWKQIVVEKGALDQGGVDPPSSALPVY